MKEYFNKYEFFCCKECGKSMDHMSKEFMWALNRVRDVAGIPFIVTSSIRCKEHNKDVGGSSTSSHLTGHAVDIKCNNSADRFKIIEACFDVGIYRIGVGKDFIHLDDDPDKPDAIWVY